MSVNDALHYFHWCISAHLLKMLKCLFDSDYKNDFKNM